MDATAFFVLMKDNIQSRTIFRAELDDSGIEFCGVIGRFWSGVDWSGAEACSSFFCGAMTVDEVSVGGAVSLLLVF
jgi:hypothetical protein